MDWVAPVSTSVGGLIGLGSAVVTEEFRSRRASRLGRTSRREQLYADYLAALAAVLERLRVVGRLHPSVDDPERVVTLAGVFSVGDAYALRYRSALFATADVQAAGRTTFRRLRDVRNALQSGQWDGPEVVAARAAYWREHEQLVTLMRAEADAGGRS